MIKLRYGQLRSRGSIPRRSNRVSLLGTFQTGNGAQPVSYSMNTWGSFPGGKAAGADESTAPRAAVGNEWSYTSIHILIDTGV